MNINRDEVERQLERERGKHLIFVRYGAQHSFHNEWVCNSAHIDAARIVWARSLDAVSDGELVRYYDGRRVWTVDVDRSPPFLTEIGVSCRESLANVLERLHPSRQNRSSPSQRRRANQGL